MCTVVVVVVCFVLVVFQNFHLPVKRLLSRVKYTCELVTIDFACLLDADKCANGMFTYKYLCMRVCIAALQGNCGNALFGLVFLVLIY